MEVPRLHPDVPREAPGAPDVLGGARALVGSLVACHTRWEALTVAADVGVTDSAVADPRPAGGAGDASALRPGARPLVGAAPTVRAATLPRLPPYTGDTLESHHG